MAIRPALSTDAASMSSLIKQWSHTFLDDSRPEDVDAFFERVSATKLAEAIRGTGSVFLVAEDNGLFQGFIALRNGTHISQFFVEERFQRQGIGQELWAAIQAKAERSASMRFTVNANVSAVGFYEKLGFTATAGRTVHGALIFIPMATSPNDA